MTVKVSKEKCTDCILESVCIFNSINDQGKNELENELAKEYGNKATTYCSFYEPKNSRGKVKK